MLQLTEDELGEIIELTEEMCTRNGWVNEIAPPAKKRMEIITRARSRPHPAPAPRPPCEECIYQAQAAERERKAREEYDKELWVWCLTNGAEQHGDIIGLPADPFFPLKLIKKIAEMHFRAQQQAGDP